MSLPPSRDRAWGACVLSVHRASVQVNWVGGGSRAPAQQSVSPEYPLLLLLLLPLSPPLILLPPSPIAKQRRRRQSPQKLLRPFEIRGGKIFKGRKGEVSESWRKSQ